MKAKQSITRYVLEVAAIVIGLTISFMLEDYRQKQELKILSDDLTKNLLNEIYEIEKYLQDREKAYLGDRLILKSLMIENINLDSVLNLNNIKSSYTVSIFGYRGFQPPTAFYKSLINDGKIRYLESTEIKKELDLMHSVNSYYIGENIKDEVIAERKIIDYFEKNYPKDYLDSGNDKIKTTDFVKRIYKRVQEDLEVQSMVYQKISAMNNKIVFFNRYKKSLEKLKAILNYQIKID